MKKNKSASSLQSLVNELELQLGMNVSVNGGSLKGLPLYDFLLIMQKSVKTSDSESLKKYAYHISTFCMRLSYFNDRFAFQNRNVLDFSFYDNADVLCSFFLQYQEHVDIKDFKNKELSTFIEYIKIMEQSNSGLHDVLSYRFIRLFLTLICMGFHVDASVICQFLRNQFWIYEGLNPRTKLSNDERTKLMNKVLRDRAKYSRRFKDKMSTSIRKVNKTVSDTKEYVNSKAEDAEFEVPSDSVDVPKEPNVSDSSCYESDDITNSSSSEIFENMSTHSDSKHNNEKPKVNYSSRKIVKSDVNPSEDKLKEEQEKIKKEKDEQKRLKLEQEERYRLEKEEAVAKEKAEKEKVEKERLEQERLTEEERKRKELEQSERDRLLKEKEEAVRLKKESEELKLRQLEKLRAQKQKRELEKQEQERQEEEERLQKLVREKEESEKRKEQERLYIHREKERIARQRRLEEKQRQEELIRQTQLEFGRHERIESENRNQQRTSTSKVNPMVNSRGRISIDGNNKNGLKNSSIF